MNINKIIIPYLVFAFLIIGLFNLLYVFYFRNRNRTNRQNRFPVEPKIVVSKSYFYITPTYLHCQFLLHYFWSSYLVYGESYEVVDKFIIQNSDKNEQFSLLVYSLVSVASFIVLIMIINYIIGYLDYKKYLNIQNAILSDHQLVSKVKNFSEQKFDPNNLKRSWTLFWLLSKYNKFLLYRKDVSFNKKYMKLGNYAFWLNTYLIFRKDNKVKNTLNYFIAEAARNLFSSQQKN
ncbi:hypothetical protein EI74_0530 [Mycoplasma testudineum]|uniref:Uncharacterized protein n=1 Tax=Mycoplasma testudineum TaxID=244584 RepID=A0A4R6IE00_9MOLU|nr:hypothetical protein [Mycoplasma testudineum]OYD26755.1 hypothetical protein CG473_02255 [Mycoplasma testudineum]TDO19891.1 hypothetical protein EI74_0530 [Mycoplasma testudineum]